MSVFVHFTGKLGKDPELKGEKTDAADKRYCVIGLAVDEFVGEGKGDKDKDGNATNRKTTWVDAVLFKGAAQFVADKAVKGDTMTIVGKLEIRTYEKKDKDGNVIDAQAKGVRVVVNDFQGPMRPTPKKDAGDAAPAQSQGQARQQAAPAQARQAAPAQARQATPQAAKSAAPAAPAAAVAEDDIPF